VPRRESERLHSCLYEGVVRHRRHAPVLHAFQNRLFLAYLDLSEIDRIFRIPALWSTSRFSLAQFRRSDYHGAADRPLADCVRETVHETSGDQVTGPIRILTHLRYFGLVVNPVSFYYCFDSAGERLEAILAEVTNTPWGERHSYVLTWDREAGDVQQFGCAKEFHVSPFLPMDMSYAWRLSEPGRQLTVDLENHDETGCVFDASLVMRRRELTTANVGRAVVRYPFMTGRVLAGIYWQAFRLWWKKAPYFPHPLQNNSTPVPASHIHSTASHTLTEEQ
jgi:uncharacterized protein